MLRTPDLLSGETGSREETASSLQEDGVWLGVTSQGPLSSLLLPLSPAFLLGSTPESQPPTQLLFILATHTGIQASALRSCDAAPSLEFHT